VTGIESPHGLARNRSSIGAEASTPSPITPRRASGSAIRPVPDRQFQHSSAAGQLCEEVHGRRRVKSAIAVVINTRPARAMERRIIKPSHAVTKADADGRRYNIFTAEARAATYSSAAERSYTGGFREAWSFVLAGRGPTPLDQLGSMGRPA
jgi:hypothetical protein